jgi:hypothetical protein
MTAYSDLFDEAKRLYLQLIPPKDEGLILLALYNRFGHSDFTEDQIIEIVRKVLGELGKSSCRNEYERENQLIIRMQEFFLWRDRAKKVYRFKRYGLDFCRRINDRLRESYSPARIRRLFSNLLDELRRCLNSDEVNLNTWMEDHFTPRSNELAGQIEILDQQVSESVNVFRHSIKLGQVPILQLIESISKNLDRIKSHAAELSNAFHTTFDIDEILQQLLESDDAFPYLTNIKIVQDYNHNVRLQLEQVSLRIDKIKPKLREFIFEFNQRDLDRKTDRFIHYLLDYSEFEKTANRVKRLMLPSHIPPIALWQQHLSARFKIVPERDLLPKPDQPIIRKEIDKQRQKDIKQHNEHLLHVRKRIEHWVNEIMNTIDHKNEIDFSDYFFYICRAENGNLQIPVRTAQRVIKQCRDRSRFKIEVSPEIYGDSQITNINTWKMKIQKRS